MIDTERLVLRLPLPNHAAAIADEIGDEEVMRFIGTGETGTHADAVAAFALMQHRWDVDGFGQFVVVRREDGVMLGRVGLLAWDPKLWKPGSRSEIGAEAEVELGWKLLRFAWGHGYATEAALAARDWALSEIQPRRLISLIHPDNARSMSVENVVLLATENGPNWAAFKPLGRVELAARHTRNQVAEHSQALCLSHFTTEAA